MLEAVAQFVLLSPSDVMIFQLLGFIVLAHVRSSKTHLHKHASKGEPLWALFSFFSRLIFLFFFFFKTFSVFLFLFSFSQEKSFFFFFSCLALVSEFNCFLRSRCSMEMWCPDDKGRDSWDSVGPPARGRACFNSPE